MLKNDVQKNSKMRRQPQQARSQERVNNILDIAEQLFIELGYVKTTTRAIAISAGVPIGSLYQFFPDKIAIVRALANRYFEKQYLLFMELHAQEAKSSIEVYIDRIIDAFDQFATQNPGYRAILEQLIDLMTVADTHTLDEYDQKILVELAYFLAERNPSLTPAKCELIATILLKTSNELLLFSLSSDNLFRKQLIEETKILLTAYLQTYLIA